MVFDGGKQLNRKSLVFLLIVVILILATKLFWPFINYEYESYKINHITSKDLTNSYVNNDKGFAFNYLKNGEVFKPSRTDENNLRVFSERTSADGLSNKGATCDLNLKANRNITQETENLETIIFNNIEWKKWKVIDDTGSIFDRHFVFWYTEKGEYTFRFSSTIELEGYCQSIVSTFRFLKV